ncbi:MAG: aminotransferase class I/II-fold pyridoxal phosphate-dependent enzyme [Planctomycetaceae bacterium]|jgi:threonine aldolase|nr:aminotransferase class I/II-fold pyridoxal phosphate-dependent enzyme [Planctomycetaceae bacterium]
MTDVIDLRSDTVTQPTPEMRRAIADAEVGDAVIDVDPTVQQLEEYTADLLGMPAAVFMPSGSMTNQVAIRVHCDRGSEFLCESEAHIYHYEQAAFAQLSGLVAHTIHTENGVMTREHLEGNVRPENEHMVRTRLLCVENTHNRWGGRIQPQDAVEDICQWASENGLMRHLDGARLWNAAAATGISEKDLVAPFDSVSVCYSKGLGAPVGSALVGSEDFLYEARRARKLFGGGMRQAGIIAAGALHAVQHHRDRLPEDHEHAQLLADACEASPSLSIRGGRVDTNIIICEVDPAWGTAAAMVAKCEEQGVLSLSVGPQAIRFVTHLDVNRTQIERAAEIIHTLTESPIPKSA